MIQETTQIKAGSPVPRVALMAVAGLALAALMLLAGYSMVTGNDNGINGGFGAPPGGPGGAPRGGIPQGAQPQGQFGGPGQAPGQGVVPGQGQQPGQGGGVPNAQGGQQNFGVLPAPADIVGRVQAFNGKSLTLQTPQGMRAVQIDADTPIYRANGSLGTIADILQGRDVAVVSEIGQDRLLHAVAILILQ
ncbi:MAG TPA: hypothetical protein VI759_03980 [Dehalococcoidia bacterium]|nr:hypothetical protein [Dehalococcoidia bacterium]